MIALDTNLLLRLVLDDDAAQVNAVKTLLSSGQLCTAPITVFLECVWVLQAQGYDREDIAHTLTDLLGLPHFECAEKAALKQASNDYAAGMDFADALHVALSAGCSAFKTFDAQFIKKASALKRKPVVSAPS